MNQLIEFENLPSTKTPIDAYNLNHNFEYLESKIPKKIKCSDEDDARMQSYGDTVNEYYWVED